MSMVRNLLDLIYSAESGRNYDAWNTQTKIRSERPLTELTVAEIMAIQDKNKDNDGGAAGAGQIKKSTMQLLLNNKILSRDDKFTPEVQDRAHLFLLQNRGLNDFLSGQIDLNEYGHRLSKEYASLPSMKGKTPDMSYYEGEAKNSARVKPAEINAQLSALLDIDSEANLDLASVVEPDVVLEAFVPTAKKSTAGQYLNQASGITNNVATGVDPRMDAMAAAVMEAKKGDRGAKGFRAIQMGLGMLDKDIQPMLEQTSALQVPQRPPSAMDRFTGGIASLKDSIGNMFRMGN
jgi:hypothetical protein